MPQGFERGIEKLGARLEIRHRDACALRSPGRNGLHPPIKFPVVMVPSDSWMTFGSLHVRRSKNIIGMLKLFQGVSFQSTPTAFLIPVFLSAAPDFLRTFAPCMHERPPFSASGGAANSFKASHPGNKFLAVQIHPDATLWDPPGSLPPGRYLSSAVLRASWQKHNATLPGSPLPAPFAHDPNPF